jgi:hypothetical protein
MIHRFFFDVALMNWRQDISFTDELNRQGLIYCRAHRTDPNHVAEISGEIVGNQVKCRISVRDRAEQRYQDCKDRGGCAKTEIREQGYNILCGEDYIGGQVLCTKCRVNKILDKWSLGARENQLSSAAVTTMIDEIREVTKL